MGKIGEWFRKNFALKPGNPEKEDWFKEGMEMRDIVPIIMAAVAEEPRTLTLTKEHYMAMIAAGYAILRRRDDDWKALDKDTAWRLYVGVAFILFEIAYRREDREDEENG